MLLFALWLVLTDKLSRGEKVNLWSFAALMLLWNNIHGEYLAGFLLTGAYLAGWVWDFLFEREKAPLETGKRLAMAAALSALVTLLNPISVRAWGTVTGWLGNEYLMARTDETIPPNFAEPKFLVLLVFLSLSLFLLAIKRERLHTGAAIALAGFTVMTLTSARNIHFYGVIAPFVLAGTLQGSLAIPLVQRYESLFAQVESRARGIVWPVLSVILGIFLLIFSPLREVERFSPAFFPVQAVQWLKENPQEGEMFNPFDWSGYLSFYLPEKKVFIDSQGDVYGEAFIRKYERVITLAPGWQTILEEYNVRWALVNADWPLAHALAAAGWKEVYRDETAVVLVKGGK